MSYRRTSSAKHEECLSLAMSLGFDAAGIYIVGEHTTAIQSRESEAGKIVHWMTHGTEAMPCALTVEMALGIDGSLMARNCNGVVTKCHVCRAGAWPWDLRKYDEEAQICGNPRCLQKHARYACPGCFIGASQRVQARELRAATRREARRAALNRVPMEVSAVEVTAMEV